MTEKLAWSLRSAGGRLDSSGALFEPIRMTRHRASHLADWGLRGTTLNWRNQREELWAIVSWN